MKRFKLTKVIASTLIAVSVLALNPTGVLASWKQDSKGWWNTEGSSWSVGWKNINATWYYFDQSGYMKTGWIKDNSKWYYADLSGAMQTGIVQVDGKTYCLASSGAMLTGNINVNGQTYTFTTSGEAIGDNIPQAIEAFSKEGIATIPIEVKKADTPQDDNKIDSSTNSSSTSSSSSSSNHSSSSSSSKENVIIKNNQDIEKLNANIEYGTITLNTQEERINFKNIKASNLIIEEVDWFDLENCSINNIVVNEINEEKYPKLNLKGDNCNVGNITFNSTGRINEDIRNYKNVINNVYVNTTGRVQIIGIFNNIEILKEGADVCIGGLQSEIKHVLVKESSRVEFDYCALDELEVLQYSYFYIHRSIIKELTSNSKLDIELKLQLPQLTVINNIISLINNNEDKINVGGSGNVNNISEVTERSITISNTVTTPSAVTVN